MRSFYIGPAGARLYCNLHLPKTRLVRDLGVLLCPPVGHEYYRSYRAHVRLAEQLSDSGFTALRFDYLGNGESEGVNGHASLSGWADDAALAGACLLEQAGIEALLVVGMRFGSIIAALSTQRIERVEGVLLWEAVSDGRVFVNQLERLHDDMLADQERFPHARSRQDSMKSELVGQVYGPLLDELRHMKPLENIRQDVDVAMLAAGQGHAGTGIGSIAPERVRTERLQHDGYGWNDAARISETIVDPLANRRLAEMLEEMAA